MSRPDVFSFVEAEYPHLYDYRGDTVAGGIDEMFSAFEHLALIRSAIRDILLKKSLTPEQKLTLVAFSIQEYEEPCAFTGGFTDEELERFHYGMFQLEDVSVLDQIV